MIMKRHNINMYTFILICTLFAFGCKNKVEISETQPIKVNICVIDSLSGENVRTYVGEIEENASLSLSFVAGGRVERVLVHEGDRVQSGQLLCTVNRANAQSAYNSAKAQLDQAEDAYKRLKKVYDQGSLAEVKWVELLTALEKARSLEQVAKKQLSECSLYAPSSGVVSKCNAKSGAALLPGEPAVTLMDLKKVSVTFAVPESEIASISIGREASIVIPALDNRTIKGKITDKSMNSNPVAHSYEVKIALSNTDKLLLPGMVCKVYLSQDEHAGFVIPANCVQTRPEGLSVWILHQGKPDRRIIKVSDYVANGVVVTSGINLGDTIITSGMQKLYKGAKISIGNEKK